MALLRRTAVLVTIGTAALAGAVAVAGPSEASTSVPGTFNSVTPARVLDTRLGTGAAMRAVPAHGTITFRPTSASASAVLLTVTVPTPRATGYLTLYPTGTARPGVSSLLFLAHASQRNSVVSATGTGGSVSVYNGSSVPVHVIAALTGYWTAGKATTAGAYQPVTPTRLADSRSSVKPIAGHGTETITIAGKAGIPASATAVVGTLTAYSGLPGYVTAGAEADPSSTTWSDIFNADGARSDLVVVPVNTDGTITLYNGSPMATGFTFDADGYISNGSDSTAGTPSADGAYVPSTAYRVADTRGGSALPANSTRKISILSAGQNSAFKAVVITLSTQATGTGYVEAWNGSAPQPKADLLAIAPFRQTTTTVRVPVNDDGTISIANRSSGSTDIVVDVQGFILNDLSGTQTQIRHTTASVLRQAQARAIR